MLAPEVRVFHYLQAQQHFWAGSVDQVLLPISRLQFQSVIFCSRLAAFLAKRFSVLQTYDRLRHFNVRYSVSTAETPSHLQAPRRNKHFILCASVQLVKHVMSRPCSLQHLSLLGRQQSCRPETESCYISLRQLLLLPGLIVPCGKFQRANTETYSIPLVQAGKLFQNQDNKFVVVFIGH